MSNYRYHRELKEQYQFVESLDFNLKQSLHKYTTDYYTDINSYLRGEKSFLEPRHRRVLEDLDYIFETIPPITSNIILYRGNVSDKLNSRSFQSTSYDKDIATSYGDYIFVITALPGSKIIPLMSISAHAYEEEFLLDRDGNYQVTYSDRSEGLLNIYISFGPSDSYQLNDEVVEIEQENLDDKLMEYVRNSIKEMDWLDEVNEDDIREEIKHAYQVYYKSFPNEEEINRLVSLY